MNEEKVLLSNLIQSKKNIKRKIMEMKRGVADSDNYFRETFKPIIKPLNTIVENNKISTIQNNDNSNDDDGISEPGFNHFFNAPYEARRYDKAFGLHYDKSDDKLKIANFPVTFINHNLHVAEKYFPWTIGLWSLLCEKKPIKATYEDYEAYYEILKITKVHLKSDGNPKSNRNFKWTNIVKPLHERMKMELNSRSNDIPLNSNVIESEPSHNINLNLEPFKQYCSTRKTKKHNENSRPENTLPFFSSQSNFLPDTVEIDPDLIQFTSPPSRSKTGQGLYKNTLPQTQLVYYDDPNELVTRLQLLTSSQNAGNSSVNNEIIAILEELRERKLIL
jgi:hypothetical protein